MVFSAAAARLIPHPPNFTPIAALALFGGAQFADKRLAFGLPLAALGLSDLVLGFYPGIVVVYGSFALIAALGLLLRSRRTPRLIAAAALLASASFFAITNFAVWMAGTLYPLTFAGLAACYTAAIPFFGHTLAGDAVYTAILFGGLALAEDRWPVFAERSSLSAV
jgi:hypothetical protein